ncbi:MAG: hypothetical protein C0424_12755 [Sphingobacteriaceae bacterium]|nr:hypothetical protein [Sphingobacteriaceae bacterium]
MSTLRTVLIDDQPLELEDLAGLLTDFEAIEVVATFNDPLLAAAYLNQNEVDLLICDIEMPQLKGTDLVKILAKVPALVFCSSHPAYALEAFDLNALDFLRKPVNEERLAQCIEKVRQHQTWWTEEAHKHASLPTDNTIYIKVDGYFQQVQLDELLFIEACGNFCKFKIKNQRISVAYGVISFYDELLQNHGFLRCHRSYLVNEKHVHKFNSQHLLVEEDEIPLGKKYVDTINNRLLGNKFKAYR